MRLFVLFAVMGSAMAAPPGKLLVYFKVYKYSLNIQYFTIAYFYEQACLLSRYKDIPDLTFLK